MSTLADAITLAASYACLFAAVVFLWDTSSLDPLPIVLVLVLLFLHLFVSACRSISRRIKQESL
jgi:hypothetical protein